MQSKANWFLRGGIPRPNPSAQGSGMASQESGALPTLRVLRNTVYSGPYKNGAVRKTVKKSLPTHTPRRARSYAHTQWGKVLEGTCFQQRSAKADCDDLVLISTHFQTLLTVLVFPFYSPWPFQKFRGLHWALCLIHTLQTWCLNWTADSV